VVWDVNGTPDEAFINEHQHQTASHKGSNLRPGPGGGEKASLFPKGGDRIDSLKRREG
jgi:hypothetical protein